MTLDPNSRVLFEAALQDYERKTGVSLITHPLAKRLIDDVNTNDSHNTFLQEYAQTFKGRDGRFINLVKNILSVLCTLPSPFGEDIDLPLPPAKAIIASLIVLVEGASAANLLNDADAGDALADLLDEIKQLLNRIEIYFRLPTTAPMTAVIVKIWVELLATLALVTKQIKQRRPMKFVRRLFGEKDIEAVLQRLDRLASEAAQTTAAQTLEAVYGLINDMRIVMDDGKAPLDLMRHSVIESERDKLQQRIRSWLSPPDPWRNHNVACKSRHAGTTMWFLQSGTFSEWKSRSSGPSSLLWIHGKPGAGKSTLCSAIIQDINNIRDSGQASLAFFYCNYREAQTKELRGLLSSLLVQLCHQSDSYFRVLYHLYVTHARGSQHPSNDALLRCLEHMLTLAGEGPIYLVVDALDECSNTSAIPSPRKEVLMFVEELIVSQIPNLHVCVTSRPEADIKTILGPLTFRSVSLHDEGGQNDDISEYIRSVVNTDPEMRRWTTKDKKHVIDFLTTRADGMFRWVNYKLVYICGCPPGLIRHALAELPEALDKTYQRILREIKVANWELAHRLLQCVAVAYRPLLFQELADLLAFDFATGPIPKFHPGWRLDDPVHAVLSICSTLLAVVDVGSSPIVQFSHHSVKEFLTSTRLAGKRDNISRRHHVSMTLAHTVMAQACLGILLHLDETISSDSLQKFPLAEYAAQHWVVHAQFENVSRNVEDGMKHLFDPTKPYFNTWIWIYDPVAPWWRTERPSQPRGTPLHFAALYGLHTIVKFLVIEHSQDVNARGYSDHSTSLHLASDRGHLEAVRVLLGLGADATAKDEHGLTPLHRASQHGHLEVVRVLLEYGVDATSKDKDGLTPLHRASQHGHVEVVRLLLGYGADVDTRDNSNWTPLHDASHEGYLELIQILLEHGASANALDHGGWAPLQLSSHSGHIEVVRILLENGGDANTQDNTNWTPLHGASQQGHLGIAQVLLERGAEANSWDDSNQTPLHLASRAGHHGIVRLLIAYGANTKGRMPFQEASFGGHRDIMELELWEHGAEEGSM